VIVAGEILLQYLEGRSELGSGIPEVVELSLAAISQRYAGSKTKITPLNLKSIPHLKLCGALLVTCLLQKAAN